jgi:putative endopeptidase
VIMRMRLFRAPALLLALGVAVAPCYSASVEDKSVSTQPAGLAHVAAIGTFGLDLSAGNSAVKPGDDFFAYASGKWYDHFEIPADKTSYGAFNQLDDLSKQRVREIIEQAAASHPAAGTAAQKIGDYYAAYLDQAAIETNGLTPVEGDLKRISSAATPADIATLFGLPGFASLFDLDLPPDLKNPDRYSVVISQSSLGLPDRDYYLKDEPKLQEIRGKYVAYIEQILTLGGVADAAAKAKEIMAFETAAAKVQWPIEKRRDVDATYNPRTKQQLLTYAPGFPWQAFLQASSVGGRQDLVLSELTAVHDLADLFKHTALPTLKAYLTFHYLSDHAAYLPRRFDDARFAFYGNTLRGQPQQRERWKRAVDEVNGALGELVGQL